MGIGFTNFYGNCKIIGTGFIVNQSGWIMSNRHVFEPLLDENNHTGVYTTSGLGLAIPSSRFPKEWLSKD